MLLLSVDGDEQVKTNDELCGATAELLCVKDVLKEIAGAARNIHILANKIEHNIYQRDSNKQSLENNINYKTTTINSTLPLSKNHEQFYEMNNIDKSDFIHLIKEEYFAVIYLYNSIKNLRHSKSIFGDEFDDLFDTIQISLQENMICNYRSVLRVYAENWLSIHEVNGIQLGRIRKREITSIVYNTYSIITVRLLRQWMESIDSIIKNLENKFF